MRSQASAYIQFLKNRRALVLLTTLFITLFWGYFAAQIQVLNALGNMLPEKDPDLVRFQKFNDTYGGDFMLMLGFETEDIFAPGFLKVLHEITESLEGLPELESVASLTNANHLTENDGDISFQKFISDHSKTEGLKDKAKSESLFDGYLTHPEKPVTALYAVFKELPSLEDKQSSRDRVILFTKSLTERLQKEYPFEVFFAGHAPIEYELDVSSQNTQVFSTITISIMLAFVLYLLFRHKRGVLLILLVIVVSALWTSGFIVLLGKKLNFVTTLLPSLILIVAVLDGIHIYAVFRKKSLALTREERMAETLEQTFVPCLLTTVTTAIGFGSLMLSQMEVIRDFGLFAVFGILAAFFLSVVPLPLVLLMMKDPKTAQKPRVSPIFAKGLALFQSLYDKHWRIGLSIFVIGILGFGFGLSRLIIEDKPVLHYEPDHVIRKGFDFFDKNFIGSTTIDVVVEGPDEFYKDPRFLKQVDELIGKIEGMEMVDKSLSIVNYLKRANQLFAGLPEEVLPNSSPLIAQLLLVLEGQDDFTSMVSDERNSLRIHYRVPATGSRIGRMMYDKVEGLIAETIKPPLKAHSTGTNVVWMNMESYITWSLIKSFSVTLVMVSLIMSLFLKSWKWGLFSMIPNVVPVVIVFGLMGWMEVRLNLVTLMIASISIGVAVDDTIHLVLHIRKALKDRQGIDEAVHGAFDKVGVPVITTSLILFFGFMTLTYSEFVPARHFGFFTAITVLVALLSDLILLPALMKFVLSRKENV